MSTTVVLYARYSTDMQSAASVEDQLRLLRQHADRQGWQIIDEQADRAISGTVRNRPGLNAALAAIEQGTATILLAEALDRVSRDQEDIAGIYKRIRFHGGRIVTLSEGDVGSIHIGIGGTMSAVYVEQLAEKTRRGQIGRAHAGMIPGGLSYGYRLLRRIGPDGEVVRGEREIDPDQAAIVRRIFTAYAEGRSMFDMVRQLNAERVPAPRGGLWRVNTITGSRQRRNGILYNELYQGRLLYNRQAFRKDPDTRKRLSRVNDPADIVAADVPHLRIVDDALWQAAQARLGQHSARPGTRARRPRRLLSGKLSCGTCGAPMVIRTQDRWGCRDAHNSGTCANRATIDDRIVLRRVWQAMQSKLLAPDLISAYIAERQRLWADHRRTMIADRAGHERRLADIVVEQDRIVDAIVAGLPADRLKLRAADLDNQANDIRRQIAAIDRAMPIATLPGLDQVWRQRAQSIEDVVGGGQEHDRETCELLRGLIETIVCTPAASRPAAAPGTGRGKNWRAGTAMELTVHGQLAGLLGLSDEMSSTHPKGHTVSVVAGAGFERCSVTSFAA